MTTQLKTISLIISCLLLQPVNWANADEQLQSNIEYLKQLELEELWDTEITLDEVFDVFDGLIKARQVSIASGVKQYTAAAPAVTTVITAQDIEAIGARDLTEALRTVPGLYVSYNTLGTPIYVIRGIYSPTNPEVLMLINGVPLKSLESGGNSTVWGGMPVEMIARIEVIRGPGSAIYGADAFAGVINIVMKTAEAIDGAEMGGRVGSFETYDAWVLYGKQGQNYEIATGLIYQDTQGQQEILSSDLQTVLDAQFGTQASLTPGSVNLQRSGVDFYLDLRNAQLQWDVLYQDRWDVGNATGLGGSLDNQGRFDIQRLQTALTYRPNLPENWHFKTRINFNDTRYEIDSARIFPPGAFAGAYPEGVIVDAAFAEHYLGTDMDLLYQGWEHHLLRLGTGYNHADMYEVEYATNQGIDGQGRPILPGSPLVDLTDTSAAIYPEETRKNWYAFVQNSWEIQQQLTLTAGLRYDHYSDFGSTTNPRTALVWQLSPTLTTKLLYGKAFRAPSFIELYARNSGVLGNPNLNPEEITTTELVLDWQTTSTLHLHLNLYRFEIEDKILTTSFLDETFLTNVNIGAWDGYGGEFELRWKTSSRSSLLFNYAYAQVQQSSQDIGSYPQHQAYLRQDWLVVSNWYLNTQLYWVGERRAALNTSRATGLASYSHLDLALRYKNIRGGRSNFAIGVKNLLDKIGFEPRNNSDFPLAGRSYFVEFRYRF